MMISRSGSIPTVAEAVLDESDIHDVVSEALRAPMIGITLAVSIGLALWAGIAWGAVQTAGMIW
jgi:hypothetical protein